MCLDRETLVCLPILERAKSICRIPDATKLEIDFAEYILQMKSHNNLLDRLKEVKSQLLSLSHDAGSLESSLDELEDDVEKVIKDFFS